MTVRVVVNYHRWRRIPQRDDDDVLLAPVMPPRRSSRTRTSDAQPTSTGSNSALSDATTGKRKRAQSVAADETDVETEHATRETSRSKPASSSRTRAKPTSTTSTSKARASVGPEQTRGSRASTKTRGAGKLKEVPEVEEDSDVDAAGESEDQERNGDVEERRDEAPPARKKSRTSVDDDDDEHEEEEQPVRKPLRRGRSRQVVEDEEDKTEPAPKTRRSSAKPPSSKSTKIARASRRPVKLDSDVEEEGEQEEQAKEEDKEAVIPISDDDEALPVQKSGVREAAYSEPASKQSLPLRKPPSKSSKNGKISEKAGEEDSVPTPRPRKTAPVTPRKDPVPEQQATADEEEDDLDGFDQEYKASPRRTKRQDANKNSSPNQAPRTPNRVPPVMEEEERSLLEPRVRPQTQSQPPAVEETKGPKARLVIHKMVLVNFKSYAGRQEIGPFHKVCQHVRNRGVHLHDVRGQSFSSIVGPNGSGKSNTIDALLFVFGYRAAKMRQGKLSELIHNSARYPDLQDCRVEVHFRDINDLVWVYFCRCFLPHS